MTASGSVDPGFETTFLGWSGASSSLDASVVLVMDGDKTLTAIFGEPGADNDGDGLCDGADTDDDNDLVADVEKVLDARAALRGAMHPVEGTGSEVEKAAAEAAEDTVVDAPADQAEQLGVQVADDLLSQGAAAILAEVYGR